MALTDGTGFRLYGGQDVSNFISLVYRVANSSTIKIGDAVRVNTGGFAVRAGAGNPVLGIVQDIVDKNEVSPFSLIHSRNTGATLTGDDTVATASDNQTRTDNYIQVQVLLDPAGNALFYNDADGDLATTNLLQSFDVVAASGQIAQNTASDSNGQFQLVKLDPDNDGNASKGLFRIAEGQLAVGVDQGTAKVAA